jgi:hypothetical protein
MLMWISGAVLLIGIAVFLGAFVFNGGGSTQDVHPSANIVTPGIADQNPVDGGNVSAQKVPASPDARRVARLFLETAVARKNLNTAWAITGPWLKGIPKAEWVSGSNPVTYFPAKNLKTAAFKTLSSTKNALVLEVGPLVPYKVVHGRALRPLTFRLEVDRIGGKWLVNYFMAQYTIKHLAADSAGAGAN